MGTISKLLPKPAWEPIVVEQRSWVMVYETPVDKGWELYEDEHRGDGFVMRVLKMVRSDDVLVLTAKDYASLTSETIHNLRSRDWTEQYAQVFDILTSLRVAESEQTLMSRVVPALDVVAEGLIGDSTHRMRERYAHVSGHGFILTAAGLASAHERFAGVIERWFESVAFRRSR